MTPDKPVNWSSAKSKAFATKAQLGFLVLGLMFFVLAYYHFLGLFFAWLCPAIASFAFSLLWGMRV